MIKLFQPYVSQASRMNVQRVLNGTQLAEGPEVKLFEEEFAEKFGFEPWQVVSLNSGSAALELAYEICNLEWREVITPVLTCTATNLPLVRMNSDIVFAEIEGSKHLNLCPKDVRMKISEETGAVVFVHFGGSSAGLEEIENICKEEGIDLICDAAQALGNELSKVARFNCISLQAIKSLTSGDGGFLICRNPEDAVKARKLRWFGYDRELKQKMGDCDLEIAGFKMHMNDISAAIGRGNLSEWDKIFEHRRRLNSVYFEYWKAQRSRGFAKKSTLVPGIWNPQVIMTDHTFDYMKQKCAEAGFEIGQYHFPNYKYSVFKHAQADTPKMKDAEPGYFLLPCHLGMTEDDALRLAKVLWPA